jgi:3'-phosphoadenosine 5'-phosphosulfate sulfotransferase (PAPS reductase)/FAD synthetase
MSRLAKVYSHPGARDGEQTRQLLSLSGGKDSAPSAIYLSDRVPEMEYIFHDTDKELPETYNYIGTVETILGKPVVRTTPEHSFKHWVTVSN